MGTVTSRALLVLSCVLSSGAAGCWAGPNKTPLEYLPNMTHSVAYDSFAHNPVFADHKTLRRPADGSVARGLLPFPYGPGAEEAERAGRELDNPLSADPAVLARGKHLYESFCWVCHGTTGQGDGPIIDPFPLPPAYNSTGVRDYPQGRIFHVITRGSGRMPSYAAQIAPNDRWYIARYVATLQQLGEEPR